MVKYCHFDGKWLVYETASKVSVASARTAIVRPAEKGNTMGNGFGLLRGVREALVKKLADLTPEQLTTIPAGRKNNVLWNVGHVLVTGELLTYGFCNLPLATSADIAEGLKNETSPADWDTPPAIDVIKSRFVASIDRIEKDFQAGTFDKFEARDFFFDYKLATAADVVPVLLFHEGVHFSVVNTILKELEAAKAAV